MFAIIFFVVYVNVLMHYRPCVLFKLDELVGWVATAAKKGAVVREQKIRRIHEVFFSIFAFRDTLNIPL